MKKIIHDTLILTVITVIAGACLGYVYEITKDPIRESREKAKQEAYRAVFTDAYAFEEGEISHVENSDVILGGGGYDKVKIDEALVAADASGNPVGCVLTVTDSEGYGGDITLAMGIRNDGTLNGIEILNISETAGLGMKATTPQFKAQFANKKVTQFIYTKTGSTNDYEIDALSGATITTKAVLNAVNGGLLYAQTVMGGAANE
ncbi:MAG: RnfABCDGE type electron transport complex subunit G [Lachnospiraceae bacterium]|nr:RnfABCDGE type electron transport complex subunit G [Lachnospiraceae bacterium]